MVCLGVVGECIFAYGVYIWFGKVCAISVWCMSLVYVYVYYVWYMECV